jgi:hypothetical protein
LIIRVGKTGTGALGARGLSAMAVRIEGDASQLLYLSLQRGKGGIVEA